MPWRCSKNCKQTSYPAYGRPARIKPEEREDQDPHPEPTPSTTERKKRKGEKEGAKRGKEGEESTKRHEKPHYQVATAVSLLE